MAAPLIYAVGDIHGRYDLLTRLLAKLARDSARRAGAGRPMLIFCGDYIDRGPQSAEVVEAVLWLRENTRFELRALKGNHEQGLLDFLDRPLAAAGWLGVGGMETLESYGVTAPDLDDEVGLARARRDLLSRMPASHLQFFEALEPMAVVGDYAFVHAGIRPGLPLAEQQERDLLWIRGPFLEAEGPFEKIIVHGHSWLGPEPQRLPHRLGIDTGAYQTGVLTAVRLDAEGASFIQARITEERAEPPEPMKPAAALPPLGPRLNDTRFLG